MIKSKIIFMGTPQFAADILRVIKKDIPISAVVTQPDKAQGRSSKLISCEVKCLAESKKIPVFQPKSKEELTDFIRVESPDLLIVAAFGMILPPELLKIPVFGALNVHPSLLPKYRGPTPIEAAILAGDKKTGVTIIELTEKMDAGNIVAQQELELSGIETTPTLHNETAKMGGEMLLSVIPRWLSHELVSFPQSDDDATYTKLTTKEDGRINFTFESAEKIERKYRAYKEWPGVYSSWNGKKINFYNITTTQTDLKPGEIMKSKDGLEIGTISGSFVPKYIKLEGKNKITAKEFICGYPDFANSRLS
jgi:methionyl-tRNA formyltransferase